MSNETGSPVISAVEIAEVDWPEFCRLRDEMRALVLKRINPVWTFLHKPEPVINFQGCEILRRRG
jgi:hypothetical protein